MSKKKRTAPAVIADNEPPLIVKTKCRMMYIDIKSDILFADDHVYYYSYINGKYRVYEHKPDSNNNSKYAELDYKHFLIYFK